MSLEGCACWGAFQSQISIVSAATVIKKDEIFIRECAFFLCERRKWKVAPGESFRSPSGAFFPLT